MLNKLKYTSIVLVCYRIGYINTIPILLRYFVKQMSFKIKMSKLLNKLNENQVYFLLLYYLHKYNITYAINK